MHCTIKKQVGLTFEVASDGKNANKIFFSQKIHAKLKTSSEENTNYSKLMSWAIKKCHDSTFYSVLLTSNTTIHMG